MKRIKTNILRNIIQWGVLCALIFFAIQSYFDDEHTIDYGLYHPMGIIKNVGSYLLSSHLPHNMTGVQIIVSIGVFFIILIFSKLFCSFICPVGTVSEALGKLGDKLHLSLTVKGYADKALRSLKYILLFLTIYFTIKANELFCEKFDPFCDVTSGFSNQVIIGYSLAAILFIIVGSIFIRLFWCKYICPLGAISNIFKFSVFFTFTIGIYLILQKIGINITYLWPLCIICAGGYIIETFKIHGKATPILKVTRNTLTCYKCESCSKACPQLIDVTNITTIKDADCNLCGECISACPENDILLYNRKRRLSFLPHIATIFIVSVSILIGNRIDIPTINIEWKDISQYEKVETYTRSNLSNIKCYRSSMALASKIHKTEGVLGIKTFVNSQTINIKYDADVLDNETLDRIIFSPQKQILRTGHNTDVKEVVVSLENFFDKDDFNTLCSLLQKETDALAITSSYACPIEVRIYFPKVSEVDKHYLSKLLEKPSNTYIFNTIEHTYAMNYSIKGEPLFTDISIEEYSNKLFSPLSFMFNNINNCTDDVVKHFVFQSPLNSNNEGIIEIRNSLNDQPVEKITIQ